VKSFFDLQFMCYGGSRCYLRLIGLILLLGSCKGRPSPPDGTIDTKVMAKVLADIHVAETKASRLGIVDYDSTKAAFKYFESQIMLKYKIDTAIYRKSYDFYASNPEYLIDIYDDVKKILEKEKGTLEKNKSSNVKPTR
jgi:hypothetical protein